MPRLKDDSIAPSLAGLGEEELTADVGKPDFNRGAGGEPFVSDPSGSGKQIRYARNSSLGDTLDEKSALNNWLVSKAMEGMGRNPELVAKVIAVTPYDDHKPAWTKLREEAIQAGRGAYKADLGTAVHAMSERWEQEPTFDPGEPYPAALTAYSKCMESLGLVSQLFECQFVNDVLHVAGTADRLFETTQPLLTPTNEVMPSGALVIGDLKTGDSLEYSIAGYSVQMAGYAGGSLYDVVNNVRMPTPTIHQRWGIIMHMNVAAGTCEFLWVDLEVGRYGAHLANEVREWRRNWRRKEGYKAGIQTVTIADAALMPIEHEDQDEPVPYADSPGVVVPSTSIRNTDKIAEAEGGLTLDEAWELEEWREYCRARLTDIREIPDAKEFALTRWPKGLLAPKALETVEQAKELSAYLDRVEAQFEMPFRHTAPGQSTGRKA